MQRAHLATLGAAFRLRLVLVLLLVLAPAFSGALAPAARPGGNLASQFGAHDRAGHARAPSIITSNKAGSSSASISATHLSGRQNPWTAAAAPRGASPSRGVSSPCPPAPARAGRRAPPVVYPVVEAFRIGGVVDAVKDRAVPPCDGCGAESGTGQHQRQRNQDVTHSALLTSAAVASRMRASQSSSSCPPGPWKTFVSCPMGTCRSTMTAYPQMLSSGKPVISLTAMSQLLAVIAERPSGCLIPLLIRSRPHCAGCIRLVPANASACQAAPSRSHSRGVPRRRPAATTRPPADRARSCKARTRSCNARTRRPCRPAA